MSVYLIYNPTAGRIRGHREHFLQRALEGLRSLGYQAKPLPTPGPGSASELAVELVHEGATHIFVAGGDGTINEVLQGIVHQPVVLAALPGGTGNVLCSELGYASSLETAFRKLKVSAVHRVTAGVVTNGSRLHRYFLCMAGAGFDAEVVYSLPNQTKDQLGKMAYWFHSFSYIGRRLPQLAVSTNGHWQQLAFALISRVRNYGGDLEIARNVSLLDDDFELVLLEGKIGFQLLKYLAGIITKTLAEVPGAYITRAQTVQLAPVARRRARIQVDGEYIGQVPATVKTVPKSVKLLLPESYLASSS